MEARYWVVDFLIMSKIPMKTLIQEQSLASTYAYNYDLNKQFVSNVKSVRNSRLFLSIFCDEELLLVSHHNMDKKIHHILRIYRNYCIVFDLLRIYFFHVVV